MANNKFFTRILLTLVILGIVQNIGNAQSDRSSCYVPTYKDTPAIPKYNNKYGINCPLCRPGESMMATCTADQEKPKCEQCPVGFYMKYFNHCPRCQYCSERCDRKHQRVKKECSPTTARECICAERTYYAGDTCTQYTKCQPGEMVYRRGSPTRNTRCVPCPKGTFSPKESLSRTCQPHTVCPGKIKKKGNKKHDNVCLITTTPVAMVTEPIDEDDTQPHLISDDIMEGQDKVSSVVDIEVSKEALTVSSQYTPADVSLRDDEDSPSDVTPTEKSTTQHLLPKITGLTSAQTRPLMTEIPTARQNVESSQTGTMPFKSKVVDDVLTQIEPKTDTLKSHRPEKETSTMIPIDPEQHNSELDVPTQTGILVTDVSTSDHGADSQSTVETPAEILVANVPTGDQGPNISPGKVETQTGPEESDSANLRPDSLTNTMSSKLLEDNSEPDAPTHKQSMKTTSEINTKSGSPEDGSAQLVDETVANVDSQNDSVNTGPDTNGMTTTVDIQDGETVTLLMGSQLTFRDKVIIGVVSGIIACITLIVFYVAWKWRCSKLESGNYEIRSNEDDTVKADQNPEEKSLLTELAFLAPKRRGKRSCSTRKRKSRSIVLESDVITKEPQSSAVWIKNSETSLQDVLLHIAEYIDRECYLDFLRKLPQPLHRAKIQDIQRDCQWDGQKEVIYKCLDLWKDQIGSDSVTMDSILKALEHAKCAELAKEIRKDFCQRDCESKVFFKIQ